jgi:chromosomal replication initiation ATPase DnaA
MTKPKGGRGRKAPYETTHVRIPVFLKPIVDQLSNKYRELVDADEDICKEKLLPKAEMDKEEATRLARKILRSKKGNKQAQFEKLLTSIYGEDITLD